MMTLKDGKIRRKWFLFALGSLVVFAVIGQIACDKIALESKRGKFWGYQSGLPYQGITIGITCAAIVLTNLAVRFFPRKHKIAKVFVWMLGIAMVAWMLLVSFIYIDSSFDFDDVYYAGWWIGHVDKLEEEQKLWRKTHWFGRGGKYYQYDYEVFENAPREESRAEDEPYHSALEERYKAETVYRYFDSDTMLNVLSYFYGRWVWLAYLLIVLTSIVLGISLLPLVDTIHRKLLYCTACSLFAVITIMPALNGCALVYNGIYGPLFTGYGYAYWEFGALMAGPTLGLILGLSGHKQGEAVKASSTAEMDPIIVDGTRDIE